MSDKKYNGWTNYETWVVKLWLDNEEPSYRYWQEQTDTALREAINTPSVSYRLTGVEPFTAKERAAFSLRDVLKSEHEAALPELSGFAADLLSAAMSEVNWHEIAVSLIKEAKERQPAVTTNQHERTP